MTRSTAVRLKEDCHYLFSWPCGLLWSGTAIQFVQRLGHEQDFLRGKWSKKTVKHDRRLLGCLVEIAHTMSLRECLHISWKTLQTRFGEQLCQWCSRSVEASRKRLLLLAKVPLALARYWQGLESSCDTSAIPSQDHLDFQGCSNLFDRWSIATRGLIEVTVIGYFTHIIHILPFYPHILPPLYLGCWEQPRFSSVWCCCVWREFALSWFGMAVSEKIGHFFTWVMCLSHPFPVVQSGWLLFSSRRGGLKRDGWIFLHCERQATWRGLEVFLCWNMWAQSQWCPSKTEPNFEYWLSRWSWLSWQLETCAFCSQCVRCRRFRINSQTVDFHCTAKVGTSEMVQGSEGSI